MKKALLLITAILFLTRCSNTREPKPDAERAIKDTFAQNFLRPFNAMPKAKDFYIKVHPKDENIARIQNEGVLHFLAGQRARPQRFLINPAEKNELQGENGTTISLSADCFESKSGLEISNPVEVELKECYTIDEMLQENLTTTNNHTILDTKVAVFVSASYKGEELKLKEGRQINIAFPFAITSNYGFYYGDSQANSINWNMAPTDDETAILNAKTNVYQPEFSYKGYNLNDYLASQLEYPDEAKRNELSANVEVTFTVDKSGKVHDVSCGSTYKTFRDEITTTLQQMPKWKPASFGKRKISAQVKVNIDFNLRRKDQVVVNFNSGDFIPLAADHNTLLNDNAFAASAYEKSFDQLGWICCSRTTEAADSKADVVVRGDANTDVKIILKHKNSIISGENCIGYSRFKNIPIGTEVYVVALRYENGIVFYAMQPLKLEKQNVLSLVWKKGNEAAVRRMYRSVSS